MIRVGSANFYVGNKNPGQDARRLVKTGIDIAGIQEGHSGNVFAIKRELGRRWQLILTGSSIEEQDVPVLVSRKLDVYKSYGRRISERAQVKNIGMQRSATVVRFLHEGQKYRFINTHTNAAVQNRNTREPFSTRIKRVSEYIAGMIVLEAIIRNAKRRNEEVILTGDLNYRTKKTGIWYFSPQALFARTGMKFRNRGLDYIAVSKGLNMTNLDVMDPDETGSDHPWVFSDVTVAKRNKKKA